MREHLTSDHATIWRILVAMPLRAYIHEAFAFAPDTLAISILREYDEPGFHQRHILQLRTDEDGRFTSRTWEPFEPGSLEPIKPTFTLGHEEAHVLVAALVGFFGGVDDQRLLRKDYDAERGRVDKLTDAVIDMAKGLANPQPGPVEYRVAP